VNPKPLALPARRLTRRQVGFLHHTEKQEVARARRKKPHNPAKAHDRRSRDLPRNAEVAAIEVDDPLGLEPGDRIVTLRSIRNDPLGRLHSHRHIDEAQYQGGRVFKGLGKAERGLRAVDPTGNMSMAARCGSRLPKAAAALRLNRAERELGADGSALVHDILVQGMTMEQIGQRRGLRGQRWIDYFAAGSRNVSIGWR
jgi:hypothetical protein